MIAFSASEQKKLRMHGIDAVILFGSHAQGTAGPLSDYDFGVLLVDPKDEYDPARRREIHDTLYDLLSGKIRQLVDIDIVPLRAAPMELRNHVAAYGLVLYEGHPGVYARFREATMLRAADFAPVQRIFHKGIFAQVP